LPFKKQHLPNMPPTPSLLSRSLPFFPLSNFILFRNYINSLCFKDPVTIVEIHKYCNTHREIKCNIVNTALYQSSYIQEYLCTHASKLSVNQAFIHNLSKKQSTSDLPSPTSSMHTALLFMFFNYCSFTWK
jgi:hypothetical protein